MTDLVANGLTPNAARMRDAAREGHATATDLADYLVRKGLAFRDAHEAVARAVRAAEARACDLDALSLAELRQFSALIDDDVFGVLSLEGSVRSRDHTGGTAPRQVRAAIAAARRDLDEDDLQR
jgi:argininosuccinate lyase